MPPARASHESNLFSGIPELLFRVGMPPPLTPHTINGNVSNSGIHKPPSNPCCRQAS